MSVASAQTLYAIQPVTPFVTRTVWQTRYGGLTYGLGPASYDVRLSPAFDITVEPGAMLLVSTLEYFEMPLNLTGVVHDKSTWARMGLVVQNTLIDPGWRGHLTLELTLHRPADQMPLVIEAGSPIAQIVFHLLDEPTNQPYPHDGKYQDQEPGAHAARFDPPEPT